jgi:hypothetical protein
VQEPPPQIIARPSPSDILEWRKYHLPFPFSCIIFIRVSVSVSAYQDNMTLL